MFKNVMKWREGGEKVKESGEKIKWPIHDAPARWDPLWRLQGVYLPDLTSRTCEASFRGSSTAAAFQGRSLAPTSHLETRRLRKTGDSFLECIQRQEIRRLGILVAWLS